MISLDPDTLSARHCSTASSSVGPTRDLSRAESGRRFGHGNGDGDGPQRLSGDVEESKLPSGSGFDVSRETPSVTRVTGPACAPRATMVNPITCLASGKLPGLIQYASSSRSSLRRARQRLNPR